MDSLYNTLISLLGGGVSGWFISAHQKRLDKRDEEERRKSAELISALQEKRLKEIEESQKKMQSDFDTHLQADKSQEILNELKHLRDSNQTLNGVERKIPLVSYLFANPDSTKGDQVRGIIKTGKLNLATSIETQMTRMARGKNLFPDL